MCESSSSLLRGRFSFHSSAETTGQQLLDRAANCSTTAIKVTSRAPAAAAKTCIPSPGYSHYFNLPHSQEIRGADQHLKDRAFLQNVNPSLYRAGRNKMLVKSSTGSEKPLEQVVAVNSRSRLLKLDCSLISQTVFAPFLKYDKCE